MKIALVYPDKNTYGRFAPFEKQMALGLGYLAAYILDKNPDILVNIIDTGIMSDHEINNFCKTRYDIVGFSVSTKVYNEAVELAKKYKTSNNKAVIVFGGPHVTIMMAEIMNEPIIDYAVYGEGELTFNELINSIRNNKTAVNDLKKIDGLIFRSGGKIITNSPRAYIADIDMLPYPALHLFPTHKYGIKYPMITSRACPFSCVFCAASKIWGRKWRARSPENIIAEVEYIIKRYGPRPIEFHDDSLNMNMRRVSEICDLFINKKLKVPFSVRGFRSDIINEEIANKMKKAGCSHVAIGIESANNEMLKRMGKNNTIEKIERCITLLHSVGIGVIGQFMIGNPGETLATVKQSIEFAKRNPLSNVVFGTAVPFPGTDLWDYVNKEGKFLVEPDCTRFEILNPRIIFETQEFPKKDILEAIRLATEAGMYDVGGNMPMRTVLFHIMLGIFLRILFKVFPRSISFNVYFFLRRLRSK